MTNSRALEFIALFVIVMLGTLLLMPTTLAYAAPPAQGPTPPPPTPPPSGDGNPITQIINQIIQFPFENLVEALQNAAKSILTGTVTPLESFFSATIARWLTASPGIITPGGGIAQGDDVMGPAWRLMVKVAVLLWPLTLAIIAAIAAKDAVAAASWGIGDLKEALGGWLIAVVASATSLYWMDLANRFTNATTMAILNMSFTGEAGFQPNALTTLVFGTAGLLLTMVSLPASLVIVIFVILMGLAVLSALVFQFLARFVILYILVALAPVVIILGVLPPLSWFRYMWLRGFIMVLAIGPINALLLKLVMILAVCGQSNDPITAFVNFIGAIGVLSILITVDGVIIKGVFGAAEEVMQKSVGTVTALGTLALAGVTALAGGAIAGGAVGAAGTTAAGGASGTSATSTASTATRAGAAGAGGPARVARSAFSPGAALRGAGDVLFRQPGMLGNVGAAMRSLGGTMEQHDRDDESQARWAASQAGRGTGAGGNAPRGSAQPRNPTSPAPAGSGSPMSNPQAGQGADTSSITPSAPSGRPRPGSSNSASSSANAPSALPGKPSAQMPSTPSAQTPTVATPPGAPVADGAFPISGVPTAPGSRDAGASGGGVAGAALPPAQVPTVSPMGLPIAPSSQPTNPSASGMSREAANVANGLPTPLGERAGAFASGMSREAANVANVLPTPLGERAGAFASVFADPQQQVAAARAAVDAFNQVNAQGQGFYDVGWQGSAWDRSMTSVIASARQGLPLETMAQDAGFGGNVAGFLAQRMMDNRQPTLEVPAQAVPWHPQMAPHDWEMGAAVSNALGHRISQGAGARIYHEIRSPETGGGWNAGSQFIQTIQGILSQPAADPIAALEARLDEMQARGVVSPRAMTLWRANAKGKS